jgi:hypothetical protein
MKVVASHQCPTCGSCYRRHTFNEEGKIVKWCDSPICDDKGVKVLAGIGQESLDAKHKGN